MSLRLPKVMFSPHFSNTKLMLKTLFSGVFMKMLPLGKTPLTDSSYLDVLESIDTSNTVSNTEDTTSLLEVSGGGSSENSVLQDGGNLARGGLGGTLNNLVINYLIRLTAECRIIS